MMEPLESLDRDLIQQYYDQVSGEHNSTEDLASLTLPFLRAEQRLIENILVAKDCIKSDVRCLDCARRLKWNSQSENDADFVFSCEHCPTTLKLLRCDLNQSSLRFLKLISTENIQLVSSALHLIIVSSRYVNPLSAPSQIDNPIDILCQYREQLPNCFKFGGARSIVIADMHEIPGCQQYPVLIICDTKIVPTRYYLHAMHFLIDCQQKQKENQFIGEYLFNELTAVGNMAIKEGSVFILGPNLQNWITADMYARGKHNLKLVIPFDQLKLLNDFDELLDPERDFKHAIKEAVLICDSIGTMFRKLIIASNEYELQQQLQLYLTSAIWWRFFSNTPFEPFLYHFLNLRLFLSEFQKSR